MWRTVELGDICSVITKGTTPTSVGFNFQDDGINFIKIESIDENGNFIKSKFAKISEDCHTSLKRSQLMEGDILFSIAGALGRTAIVTREILPANTNQALAILRIKPEVEIDRKYLLYVLNSEATQEQSNANKGGVAQLNLSLSQLKTYLVSLPPLAEQQRIVAKLDAAFAEIDRAIEIAEAKEVEVDKLKASLLSASFTDDTGMWKDVQLKNLCDVFTDGDWIETKDQSSDGIRLVQTGNVKVGYFANRGDKARYVSEDTFKRLNCTEVKKGDILVSRLPEPVGRACIVPNLAEKLITAVDCTIVRTTADMFPGYLNYYMQSPQYFSSVKEKVTGATRQRISRKNLGEINISFPPLAEQKRIVAKLDAAFAEIETFFSKNSSVQENYSSLKSEILAQELQPREAA